MPPRRRRSSGIRAPVRDPRDDLERRIDGVVEFVASRPPERPGLRELRLSRLLVATAGHVQDRVVPSFGMGREGKTWWEGRARLALLALLGYEGEAGSRHAVIDAVSYAARNVDEPEIAVPEVRRFLGTLFPGRRERLRDETILAAVRAWARPAGRPRKGVAVDAKWNIIGTLCEEFGCQVPDAETIKRLWLKLQRERLE